MPSGPSRDGFRARMTTLFARSSALRSIGISPFGHTSRLQPMSTSVRCRPISKQPRER